MIFIPNSKYTAQTSFGSEVCFEVTEQMSTIIRARKPGKPWQAMGLSWEAMMIVYQSAANSPIAWAVANPGWAVDNQNSWDAVCNHKESQ